MAIIDQKLDIDHPEYKDSIVDYTEYGDVEKQEISMHGPAVASLLVGKDCGVAPGAKLVYKASEVSRNQEERFKSYPKALKDIIETNQQLSPENKVRIVSCSINYNEGGPENNIEYNISEWIETLEKAKEAGIFVVDVNGRQIGLSFVGGGSSSNKNNFESYSTGLFEKDEEENEELNKIISEGNIDEILKKLREVKKDNLVNISDIDLRKKVIEYLNESKKEKEKEIIIPSDYRTMASSWNKKGQYMYNGRGGISWSVPYLAGLFALILQVNPNIKREEIADIINESAVVNEKGLRIINPKGIIDLAKRSVSSNLTSSADLKN